LEKKIKVLVVDDSVFMRNVLVNLLNQDPEISVCGTATNGNDALQKIAQLSPDVVTLDVEMPVLDGISALRRMMQDGPLPVIMLSSLTRQGAKVTLEALEAGAFDFVTKPAGAPLKNIEDISLELREKIKHAAKYPASRITAYNPPVEPVQRDKAAAGAGAGNATKLVAIGCSTGGPQALYRFIPELPADLPAAVVVAQHMPPGFTRSLAERLDVLSHLHVKEAEPGDAITRGTVYIAPGAFHMEVVGGADRAGWFIRLTGEDLGFRYRPSVDYLLTSAARHCREKAVGVVLTGMGADGAKGVIAIKEAGGKTLAEDESTCVVYGMPKMAVQTGRVDKVVPLTAIAAEIVQAVR